MKRHLRLTPLHLLLPLLLIIPRSPNLTRIILIRTLQLPHQPLLLIHPHNLPHHFLLVQSHLLLYPHIYLVIYALHDAFLVQVYRYRISAFRFLQVFGERSRITVRSYPHGRCYLER